MLDPEGRHFQRGFAGTTGGVEQTDDQIFSGLRLLYGVALDHPVFQYHGWPVFSSPATGKKREGKGGLIQGKCLTINVLLPVPHKTAIEPESEEVGPLVLPRTILVTGKPPEL